MDDVSPEWTSRKLKEMRAILKKNWVNHAPTSMTDQHCIRTAAQRVGHNSRAEIILCQAIAKQIPDVDPVFAQEFVSVFDWWNIDMASDGKIGLIVEWFNDHPDRTLYDVLMVMDKAIANA